MPRWVKVATVSECPPGPAVELVAEDRIVALYHVEGQWYALDGVCPHQGGPLGQGDLCGTIVTCPWHGWQFDVSTGQHCVSRAIQQPRFATKVEGQDVFVDLDMSAHLEIARESSLDVEHSGPDRGVPS